MERWSIVKGIRQNTTALNHLLPNISTYGKWNLQNLDKMTKAPFQDRVIYVLSTKVWASCVVECTWFKFKNIVNIGNTDIKLLATKEPKLSVGYYFLTIKLIFIS
jgi:hypothetical protein